MLFSDVSNVFRAVNDFRSGQIKASVGVGARYIIPIGPIGPIRLEYGHKLAPQGNKATGRFHLFMGRLSKLLCRPFNRERPQAAKKAMDSIWAIMRYHERTIHSSPSERMVWRRSIHIARWEILIV